MLAANLLYWTYAANYWSLSMQIKIVAEQDALGAKKFECTVFCVNLLIVVANLVIVLLWQICYYHWCLNYTTTSSIS